MAGSSFGTLFRFTTWGESHGIAIGVVLDGVPSLIPLTENHIQYFLDRRKPGTSRHTTQRKEPDKVKILSGTYQGKTTGAPILLLIENVDQRSKDYTAIKDIFRPGHADFTYTEKYGIRDPRGGGRSSARETACRVAAGAIARKILGETVVIQGAMIQMGEISIEEDSWESSEIQNNPFFCPCKITAGKWDRYLSRIRKQGTSIGAKIEIRIRGIPAGLGEPVYDKLDADLAKAIVSINAVKGVEIGAGFGVVSLRGEQNNDGIGTGKKFIQNNAGGILGGISTGQDIIVRFAVKPTSSITIPTKSIKAQGDAVEVSTKGRHDPCIGIRAVPVGEAMVACVLADHLLRHRGIFGGKNQSL